MREAGLVEGRDVQLEVVWTASELEVSQAVVRLSQRGVKLLIPVGTTASMAVKRQTPTTPILFISVGNPLGIGLVQNLGRPGLNVTGFSDNLAELSGKYVQFATELGSPSVVHYVWYPGWTDGQYRFQATEQAVQSLKVKLRTYAINDIADADSVMLAVKKAGAKVVIVQPRPVHVPRARAHRRRRDESGRRHHLCVPARRGERRSPHLRPELWRPQPPRRRLPGENPQRHAARRSPGRAADEVRALRQPQDGESGRPHRPAIADLTSGSGHRLTREALRPGSPRRITRDPAVMGGRPCIEVCG